MKRKLELTLPSGPAGAHTAFGITLAEYYGIAWECDEEGDNYVYRFETDYVHIEPICHHALSFFLVNDVPVLDVMAGLHFTINRNQRFRRTSDDR